MKIDNKFNIGDIVYLITDTNQQPRIVTGINIRPGGTLIYQLGVGGDVYTHYEIEISETEDILIKIK